MFLAKELVDIKLDYSLNVELERSILSYSGTIKVNYYFENILTFKSMTSKPLIKVQGGDRIHPPQRSQLVCRVSGPRQHLAALCIQ